MHGFFGFFLGFFFFVWVFFGGKGTNPSHPPCQLCNLATITREYAALQAAADLPFAATLLNKTSKEEEVAGTGQRQISQPLLDCLLANHNASQMEAIQACLMPTPVVLIQVRERGGRSRQCVGRVVRVEGRVGFRAPQARAKPKPSWASSAPSSTRAWRAP